MATTYAKLRNGEWGVRVEGGPLPKAGARVFVKRKDGESREETLKTQVWTDGRIGLYSIVQTDSYQPQTCAQCGKTPGRVLRYDRDGNNGMCCLRCAALPDEALYFD